jgi:hypothetical protein
MPGHRSRETLAGGGDDDAVGPLMPARAIADEGYMPLRRRPDENKGSRVERALTREMLELIQSFDARDRRGSKKAKSTSPQRRRRDDSSPPAR